MRPHRDIDVVYQDHLDAADDAVGVKRNALKNSTAIEWVRLERFGDVANDDADDLDYLIKDLVYPGDISVLFGKPGSGKTFLEAYIAHAVATGRPIFGWKIKAAPVILFALEGSRRLNRRMKVLFDELGDAPNLHIHRLPLHLFRDQGKGIVEAVIAAIDETGAKLVIFDTLSKTMAGGGSDGKPEDMSTMLAIFADIRAASKSKPHLMLVHHPGWNNPDRGRGASNLLGEVDLEMRVAKEPDGSRTLEITKSRDGVEGLTYTFKLDVVDLGADAEGDRQTTCRVVEDGTGSVLAKKPTPIKLMGKKQKLAYSALKEAIDERPATPPTDLPFGTRGTSTANWQAILRKRSLETDPELKENALRMQVSRAKDDLQVKGVIQARDGFVWIVREAA